LKPFVSTLLKVVLRVSRNIAGGRLQGIREWRRGEDEEGQGELHSEWWRRMNGEWRRLPVHAGALS